MKKKKRTKADLKKRELSDSTFLILDKDGKVETEIEEGEIKRTKNKDISKEEG